MSDAQGDRKPKGIDLSKLLKKKDHTSAETASAAEATAVEASAGAAAVPSATAVAAKPVGNAPPAVLPTAITPTPVSAESTPKSKLDLAKLITAKPVEEPPPEEDEPFKDEPEVVAAPPPRVVETPPPKAPPPPVAKAPLSPAPRSSASVASRPLGASSAPKRVAAPPVATPPVATPPVATPPVATPPVATPPVATPVAPAATPTLTAAGAVAAAAGVDATHTTTRFVASVETIASTQGAQRLRLDLTVGEDIKFPRGAFGVDELYLGKLDWLNIARKNFYKCPAHLRSSGFSVHFETTGAIRETSSMVWDGEDLTLQRGHIGTPAAHRFGSATGFISMVRGVLPCMLAGLFDTRDAGSTYLLHLLGLKAHGDVSHPTFAGTVEVYQDAYVAGQRLREISRDAIDYFCRQQELRCRAFAEAVPADELFMVRLIFEGDPIVEVIFHYQDRTLHILRGRPGETLPEGSVNCTFTRRAQRAIGEREADHLFLARAGHITFQGDLRVLERSGLFSATAVLMFHHMRRTKALISESNPFLLKLDLKGPPDPWGEETAFG